MRAFLGVAAVVIVSPQLFAQEATPKEIRALVEQLASPNPKPITGSEDKSVAPNFRLPKEFDKTKQKAVHEARAQLKKLGPSAFPFLIERWEDKRYCVTKSVGINGYCYNATVGDVCRDIIYDQLQPYGFWPVIDGDPRGKPKRPGYPSKHLGSAKTAETWFEQHKGKTLFEMQLMVIDWVIEEETKNAGNFTDAEKSTLEQIRADLIKEGKPINRGNYSNDDIEA